MRLIGHTGYEVVLSASVLVTLVRSDSQEAKVIVNGSPR